MEDPSNQHLCSDSDEDFHDSVTRVFEIDLIRDIILDYVIHDRKGVLISNVRCCRLVNKLFHQSVTRILLECREPLFRFHLTWRNCTTEKPDQQMDSTLVDQFIQVTTGSQSLYQRVPSHSIRVTRIWDTLLNENVERNISAWLTKCGCGLVALDSPFLNLQGSVPLNVNVSLPKLRVLQMSVAGTVDYDLENHVQSILNSSENLQLFTLKYDGHSSISANFLLPSSVAVVDLDCTLRRDCDKLAVLAKNPLPNLRELKLFVKDSKSLNETGGIITDILKNVQNSLQKFSFRHYGPSVTFKLSLMHKLESLEMKTKHLEMDGELSSLEQLVPMLSHMAFTHHTISMFEKWTKKSCFKNVTSLEVDVYLDMYEHDNDGQDDDADDMLRPLILQAFPNLQKLNITVGYFENAMSRLVLLMTKIKTLQHLRIVFKPHHEMASSGVWDALLIGIPKERLSELRESPELWKDLEKQSTISIRNLTELQTLELDGEYLRGILPMSQVALDFGIFKMPKLSKLILEGAFYTEDMEHIATKWQLEKHVISAVGEVVLREQVFTVHRFWNPKSSHFSIKTVLNSQQFSVNVYSKEIQLMKKCI